MHLAPKNSIIYRPHCRWGRWEKKQLLFVMGIVLFLALPSIELSPWAMNSGHFFHLVFNAQWHFAPKLCSFRYLFMSKGWKGFLIDIKLHDKFESVWSMDYYSNRYEKTLKNECFLQMSAVFFHFVHIWISEEKYLNSFWIF